MESYLEEEGAGKEQRFKLKEKTNFLPHKCKVLKQLAIFRDKQQSKVICSQSLCSTNISQKKLW